MPNPALFVSPAADRARLPVLLLTGFLGAGKTTLINRLLAHPALADTAVAINEFGEVPLDSHLIDHGAERTVMLANGCLCCTLSGDFESAAMRVFTRRATGEIPRFARLIVEPSGLADPAPIAQAILRAPRLARCFRLEAILAVADATGIADALARQPEAARQLACADLIALSKTDRAPPGARERMAPLLAAAAPDAELLPPAPGPDDLPPGFLDPAAPLARPRAARPFADPPDPGHLAATEAVTLTAADPLDWRALEAWLREIRLGHADSLLRLKGLLDIAGQAGPVLLQGVGHVVDAPVAWPRWPDQDRRSRLVLILRGTPGAPIRAAWARDLPGLLAH
ncbi:MAG: GTP-binding protein [Rhodospirillales bacterium]|nr:GTP-binding protein [Rhodospirillales bacterium]